MRIHIPLRIVRPGSSFLATALLTACLAAPAFAAIVVDANVSGDQPNRTNNVTTPAFSTTAPNELLLAFVSSDASGAGVTVTGVTGANLTWTLVRRTNVQLGTAEIWRAFATSTLSNATVRANLSQSIASSITVVSFSGVDATGSNGTGAVGATASGNANPGAPTATLVTTRANSWVWGVGVDWDNPILRTPGPNQTIVHTYRPPANDTYWVQRQNATTPVSGTSVTLNCTVPTTDRYNLTAVEVLPAGATYSISGIVSPAAAGTGTVLTLSGAGIGTATANASGNFTLTGLGNGTYTVTPSKIGFAFSPTSRTVTVNGGSVTAVDFTATAVPTYTITGVIAPAASGSGSSVALSGPQTASATANASGGFSFTGLQAGTYTVTPGKTGFTFTPPSRQVTITNANASGVDFAVAPTPLPLRYPDLTDIIPASGMAIVGTGAERMFQYTHLTFNGGSGPLVIQPEYSQTSGNYLGTQYVYTYNSGTWTVSQQMRGGGAFVFHAAHGHFHYPFARYGLYAVAPGGGIGAPVVLSSKVGFCIADSYIYDSSLPQAGAIGNLGSCSDPLSLRGIDIGAVDEYDKTDDGQSISLSGVPDGTYWLRAIVDPDNYLVESNENNNETDVKLTITGSTIQVLQNVTPVQPPLPTIVLTSPVDAATVAGIVNLTASTPSPTGVQYLIDGLPLGSPVLGSEPFAFAWNSAAVPDGIHWLAAQTTDLNGRTNTSSIARVTVSNSPGGDVSPPVVTVVDPEDGETVSASVAIGVHTVDQSAISGVQIKVDGVPLGASLTTPPFIVYWNTLGVADGPHTITASATDAGGRTGNSTPLAVDVDNSHPPDVIAKEVQLSVDGLGTLQTAVFSTANPNDFVVAFISYDGPFTGGQTATVTGGGLSWTLLKRSNAQPGTSEIWGARASGLLSNVSVACEPGIVHYRGSMTVIAFTNSSGAGVVGQTSAPTGAPDIYVPGVGAGSWVFAAGNDWDQSVTRVPVAGQEIVHQYLDAASTATYWVQSTTVPSAAFALVTIHDNAPTGNHWNYCAVEIVATRSDHNTAPTAAIQTPANNSFYFTGSNIDLAGIADDDRSPSDSLAMNWNVDLAFGSGRVQGAYATFSGATASYPAANVDDGTGVRQIIEFTASDPAGLVSDTARVTIWPEIDLSPSAVIVTPDPPIAGQPANYTFSVNNAGRMPAQASRWFLRAGNTVLGQANVAVGASGTQAVAVSASLPSAGTYLLRLTADSLGTVHETDESNNASLRSLTVNPVPGNHAPVAVAVGIPSSGTGSLAVSFSGASSNDSDGDSLMFAWTFGDGGSATGRLTSHTYSAGNYAAVLTVNDGRGGTDTASVAVSVAAPPVTFPATAVLDNFNRANGAPGANWIDEPSQFTITSNVLVPRSGDHYIEWNGASFGPNQEVFVTLAAASTANEQNMMLKTQGTTWKGGHIEVSYNAANSRVRVFTFAPPSTWVTWGQLNGITFAAGNQFGARALSDGTVRVYKNGALVGTVSVAGWPYAALGGRIGLSGSSATSARFDNFGGGNAPATALLGEGPVAMVSRPVPGRAGDSMKSPALLALSVASPNPSTGGVSLVLDLPRESDVSLRVLDIMGREVWSGGTRSYGPGSWTLGWDGRGDHGPIRSGIYLMRVRAGAESFTRRFALIR